MDETKVEIKLGALEDFNLPPMIYKYRHWSDDYHKRFITEREVYLASAETFEDELDCRNPTRFDLLTKQQIYDYFFWSSQNENPKFTRQQHRKFSRQWAKESDVNHPKIVKKWMDQSIKDYYAHEGILSLTENWNNPDMWNAYADNEKGFCIGYDTKILFNHLGGGGEVIYVDELPEILPEPFMQPEVAMQRRVYYKTKKWEFEDEYRTKKFWPNPAKPSDRQIKLPKETFKQIILGDNISDSDRAEIKESVLEHIGEIEIVERKNAT